MKVDAERLEDRLGEHEPPYKSRGEAQVGRLLDRYGLPFIYENPLVLYDRGRDRTWHPDFTLPTYAGLVLEYAGMPDRPEYMEGIRHKARAYAANGIRALFIYPQDLKGPNWPERLVGRITSTYTRGARDSSRGTGFYARGPPARSCWRGGYGRAGY